VLFVRVELGLKVWNGDYDLDWEDRKMDGIEGKERRTALTLFQITFLD